MFWGSVVFEFVGVLIRYFLQFIIHFDNKEKRKTFKELWLGSVTEDPGNDLSFGCSNIFIGFIVFVVVAIIYLKFFIE